MSLSDDLKNELLRNISTTGASMPSANVIIASRSHSEKLLNLSSGLPTFTARNRNKFKLILAQPDLLQRLNSFQIKCCLCGTIISYPAWYHREVFAVNQVHYFVCFNRTNPNSVTAKCYRR